LQTSAPRARFRAIASIPKNYERRGVARQNQQIVIEKSPAPLFLLIYKLCSYRAAAGKLITAINR